MFPNACTNSHSRLLQLLRRHWNARFRRTRDCFPLFLLFRFGPVPCSFSPAGVPPHPAVPHASSSVDGSGRGGARAEYATAVAPPPLAAWRCLRRRCADNAASFCDAAMALASRGGAASDGKSSAPDGGGGAPAAPRAVGLEPGFDAIALAQARSARALAASSRGAGAGADAAAAAALVPYDLYFAEEGTAPRPAPAWLPLPLPPPPASDGHAAAGPLARLGAGAPAALALV